MITFLKIFIVVLLALAFVGWLADRRAAANRPDVTPGLSFLPGDIKYQSPSGNVRVYFPIVTSIVLSVVLTLILRLFGWVPQRNRLSARLGTPSALTMLGVAAFAEVLAYYVPVIDNLLDALATPAALVAGTVVSAAVMTDVPPMVKWTAAVIAGGGIAGLTQGVTGMLRAHSTVLTGGLGNTVIATAELCGALLISFLALAAPAAAIALVILFLLLAIRVLRRLFRGARASSSKT
jgi:hypothetical protein